MRQKDAELLARRHQVMGEAPLFYDEPLHLVRGEGVYLFSAEGRRYLDCYNNIPVVGHCNPRVVEAMCQQARALNTHSRYLNTRIVEYAERLLPSFAAEFQQVLFTCTGSEANEQALRIARALGRGRGIICSNFAYHGNTTVVDEVSPLFSNALRRTEEVRTIAFPDTYRGIDELEGEALLEAYVANVRSAISELNEAGVGLAGLIVCPLFANEGLPRIPRGFLEKICALVREAGGLVIADEVQAGFGRTGTMWGHELMGFRPDIVTLGKPMGNGYPVAALVSRAELLDAYRREIHYFNTFAGGPVAAAAASAVLDVIAEENLLANARKTGDAIRRGLRTMAEQYPGIGDIRGEGLWVGMELVRDRKSKEPATREASVLVNQLKERGVLTGRMGGYDQVVKIRPPLVFAQQHVDELLSAMAESLRSTYPATW